MFCRGNAPEILEDFINISISELDAVIGFPRDGNLFTQSDAATTLSTPSSSSSNKGQCGVAEGLTHSL